MQQKRELKQVSVRYEGPQLEEKVLRFWKAQDVFAKTLQHSEGRELFTFNEGPPTANGKPGLHHVLARAFKDAYPRYRTMRGFHCPRKAGWDCHGLPVEHEVEKELGIFDKQEIETKVGVAEFTRRCRESVMRYVKDWERMTERMGFWVNMEDAYFTLDNSFIESVWHLLKQIWDQGLIEKDYKVVPYDPQVGATMSSHEVALGYKQVEDPSVFVRFRLQEEEGVSFLAWTTTPWTLPSNLALAVHPEAEYLEVELPGKGERFILAAERVQEVLGDIELRKLRSMRGRELEGMRYQRLFDDLAVEGDICRVVLEPFVHLEDGTGVVHLAPAYGADDLNAARRHGLPVLHAVGLNGRFLPEIPLVAGKFFKEADAVIIQDLEKRGLLFRQQSISHNYPHGWRTGAPLIYYAKEAWFIRTSQLRERMVELNQEIDWTPQHIRDGRFGNWLANNVDWALSRERFWGTPLPIWTDGEGDFICIGSVSELEKLCGRQLDQLDLHRPTVDEVSFAHPKTGCTMRRVPEVIDCWFDSGAMPYAQWHYPFENKQIFQQHFPVDFICEAIDQTRGWFYSLHAIATLVSDQAAFRHVVCLSHIVDERGRKMSKSLGNVIDPFEVFNQVGADPLRWHFLARVSPDVQKRVSLELIHGVASGFLNTYWNTYAFLVTYASLDKIDFNQQIEASQRSEIDRWALALLEQTVQQATAAMEKFDARTAGEAIELFVDQLSNWYIRRNRRRFWKSEHGCDKHAAYLTLFECLETVNRLMAPLMPFITEEVHQNLVRAVNPAAPESVHLASWPHSQPELANHSLVNQMEAAQKVVSLGRAAREKAGIRIRQPLGKLSLRLPDEAFHQAVTAQQDHILEELNIKQLEYLPKDASIAQYHLKPNLPLLGKRLGKDIPLLKKSLASVDAASIAGLQQGGSITLQLGNKPLTLTAAELLIETSSQHKAAAEEGGLLAILDIQLNDNLQQEGLARELIRSIQEARKQAKLQLADRITLHISGSQSVEKALASHKPLIMTETLATSWGSHNFPSSFSTEHQLGEHHWKIQLAAHTP